LEEQITIGVGRSEPRKKTGEAGAACSSSKSTQGASNDSEKARERDSADSAGTIPVKDSTIQPVTRVERIVVTEVTRTFGAVAALRGVSAELRAGEIVALEGPNGAGKSTLLAVLATVIRPTFGRVAYEPLGDDPDLVRPELGWVSHESLLYRELTGRENIELAARLYGVDDAAACERACMRVEAGGFVDRRVGTLSRGQRQRIALARALVHAPSVLLLDEPWTGLDASSAALLERELVAERERGTLVVVVTHAAEQATRIGARRLRLEGGRVVRRSPEN
jgi:ABC-type multidrug transport system ATPase subunit